MGRRLARGERAPGLRFWRPFFPQELCTACHGTTRHCFLPAALASNSAVHLVAGTLGRHPWHSRVAAPALLRRQRWWQQRRWGGVLRRPGGRRVRRGVAGRAGARVVGAARRVGLRRRATQSHWGLLCCAVLCCAVLCCGVSLRPKATMEAWLAPRCTCGGQGGAMRRRVVPARPQVFRGAGAALASLPAGCRHMGAGDRSQVEWEGGCRSREGGEHNWEGMSRHRGWDLPRC